VKLRTGGRGGHYLTSTAPGRFWKKVTANGECWIWKAACYPNGYGMFDGGYAHRWAYEHMVTEIPPGLELDHLCRVRNCVNPWHLEPVTHAENHRRRRGIKTGPRDVGTHCRQGHERSANTRLNTYGYRICVLCARAAVARHRQKQLA
jgi:hypothetical protein